MLQVKERELPELDDEFAQMASEFDTLDELRADVVGQVERQKRFAQVGEAREKLSDALLAAVEVPVPQQLIEDEVHRHLENEQRLDDDVHRAEVTESSEKSFKAQLLFDAVAEAENVQVSQDELAQYLVQGAQQYGMQPQEFVEVLQQNNQLPSMMSEVARSKAIAVLLGQVKVVDTDGNAVDVADFVASAAGAGAEDSEVEDADAEDADAEDAEAEDAEADAGIADGAEPRVSTS